MRKKIVLSAVVIVMAVVVNVVVFHNYSFYDRPIAKVKSVAETSVKAGKDRKVTQEIVAKMMNGKYKGKIIHLRNKYVTTKVYDSSYDVGNDLFVSVVSHEGDELRGNILSYKSDKYIVLFASIFIVFMVLVGSMKGVLSLITLVVNSVIFYGALLLYMKGYNLLILSVIMAVLFTVISLVVVGGFKKMTLVAVISTLVSAAGIFVMSSLILWYGHSVDYDFMEYLIKPYKYYDAVMLFIAEIFLCGLGAIMDVAITMSSSVNELLLKNPDMDQKALYHSCQEIGYDIMGTMVNVLFFSNLSGCMPFFVVAMRNEVKITALFHYYIPYEMTRFLTGSIGIVMTIPIATFIAIKIYKRGGSK